MADFRSLVPFGRRSLMRGGYDPFAEFREEMDRMLQDVGRGVPAASSGGKDGFLIPKVDVAETDAGLELTAELPGFDEKDVSLDIHDGVLTIKAVHTYERDETDEKKHYHLVERSQGTFLRRLALPFEADADKASAHLDKGLLKVTVPRLATAEKKPKAIPITQPGLDDRHRDTDGRISTKHGNTRVDTLRQTYGDDFAAGFPDDMLLSTLLEQTGHGSLSEYLKDKK